MKELNNIEVRDVNGGIMNIVEPTIGYIVDFINKYLL